MYGNQSKKKVSYRLTSNTSAIYTDKRHQYNINTTELAASVSSTAIAEVDAFCDTHKTIIACEQILEEAAMDQSNIHWLIEWHTLETLAQQQQQESKKNKKTTMTNNNNNNNKKTMKQHFHDKESDDFNNNTNSDDEQPEPYRPTTLNSPGFKNALRSMMTKARRLVRRHGFCTVWYLSGESLVLWWDSFLKASPSERSRLGLPMGIVDNHLVNYTLEANHISSALIGLGQEHLVATLNVEKIANMHEQSESGIGQTGSEKEQRELVDRLAGKDVQITVYTRGAKFTPHHRHTHSSRRQSSSSPSLSSTSSVKGEDYIVCSPFHDLIDDWRNVIESRTYHFDADAIGAYPRTIFSTELLQPTRDQMTLATADRNLLQSSPIDTILNQRSTFQSFSLSEAAQVLHNMQRQAQHVQALAQGHDPHQSTTKPVTPVSSTRRAIYGRPTPYEDTHVLPASTRFEHMTSPQLYTNTQEYLDYFERQVACIMQVSIDFIREGRFNRDINQNTSYNIHTSHIIHNSAANNDTIQRERAFYVDFFDFTWSRVFSTIDMRVIEELIDHLSNEERMLIDHLRDLVTPEDFIRLLQYPASNEYDIIRESEKKASKQQRQGKNKNNKNNDDDDDDDDGDAEMTTQRKKQKEDEEEEEEDNTRLEQVFYTNKIFEPIFNVNPAQVLNARKTTRRSLRYLHALLASLRQTNGTCSRLVFQYIPRRDTHAQFEMLLNLVNQKIIDPTALQPYINTMFGPDVNVRQDYIKAMLDSGPRVDDDNGKASSSTKKKKRSRKNDVESDNDDDDDDSDAKQKPPKKKRRLDKNDSSDEEEEEEEEQEEKNKNNKNNTKKKKKKKKNRNKKKDDREEEEEEEEEKTRPSK